ncbi:UNVERIFIED_CONTAM: NDR1/HIN1-like protein 13 [Sesamum radiatum]|uniref:NDR1/HIN1-like protein 13 n=1 Tax=Sesamum radiatum TaxID=300843 RepID=A0AAW2W1K4_SESRA
MADSRVHPTTADSNTPPPPSSSAATSPKHFTEHPIPPNPPPSKPVPPPATYVVQLPREQILRYPPPENARKFQALTRRKNRRSCCRRCCCFTLCLLVFLVIAAAVSAGVLYLVFRFKSPKYTVTHLAIKGMNLTSAAPISPGFDVTIRAENPNGKVGIYYLKDSAVNVFYNDVKLSSGVLPAFYQPRKNVTVMQTALTGSDVVLGGTVKTALRNAQNQGRIPFVVKTKAPVKIEVGSVKTWEITVKVKCDVVMDGLNQKAQIVSHDCDYSVRLW